METTPSIDRKKLAEENHNLIYWFCWKNHLDIDEWYDIIAIGYMKGINSYDETLGVKLSVYLNKIMKNEYLMVLRLKQAKSRISETEISSLEFEFNVGNGSNGEKDNANMYDIISDKNSDFEERICIKIDLENALKNIKIKDRYRRIYDLRIKGYTYAEIAEIEKCTRARIQAICKNVNEKLKTHLTKGGGYFEN